MSFTDEERRDWHEQKRLREAGPEPVYKPTPIAVCIHCHNPFAINDGVVTEEVALCDVCNGD